MAYEVVFSPAADLDLSAVVGTIENERPGAGIRMGLRILAQLNSISDFPLAGHIVPEFQNPELRELAQWPYRIVYRVVESEKQIEVVRIWHTARGTPEVTPPQ
ncbi:MAG: type II toxin-antitoxin system RelE/ParE family toxin [Planctomycetes bacterium]|nr:type II toxin-antitoxin system RelE/ParE family toxin [Planctomycetota bacterium]